MNRGHTLSRQTGQALANERRNKRYEYIRKRAKPKPDASGGVIKHFKTPGGGLPAFDATTKVLGSAACRRWDCDEDDTLIDSGADEIVRNAFGALPGSIYILAAENARGILVALPVQFDVRLKPDGSALQKSYDGGITWTTFATIGECG